jgi:hypothetical protein
MNGIAARGMSTDVLVSVLMEAEVGETVTYERLTRAIARNVQEGARSNLTSARRICRNEHGLVFATLRNVGIVRIEGADKLAVADNDLKSARRRAKRAADVCKTVTSAEYASMTDDEKKNLQTCMVIANLMRATTDPRMRKELKAAADPTQKLLPMEDALARLTTR